MRTAIRPRILNISGRKLTGLLFVLAGLIFITGCGGGGGSTPNGGGGATALTADMSGAVSLAIQKASSGSQKSSVRAQSTTGVDELVKVNTDGTLTPVLNQSLPVYYALETPSHVIVVGEFTSILDTSGNTINCYLISFPLTAAGEAVKCLSQIPVGHSSPYDHVGFAVRGEAVFFAEPGIAAVNLGNTFRPSQFWTWDGVSDATNLLIQLTVTRDSATSNDMVQPFASENAANVCVLVTHLNAHGSAPVPPPRLICGDPSSDNWAQPTMPAGTANNTVRDNIFQLGNLIVLDRYTLSLSDLSVVPVVSGHTSGCPPSGCVGYFGLPRSRADTLFTRNGGAVAITDSSQNLIRFDAAGNAGLLDNSVAWERIIGDGNYGWAYGASQLYRIDLADGTLDTANRLGDTHMLQVTDMSFSTDNRIRLDGTGTTGAPVIVSIDTTTGAIAVVTQEIPRLGEIIPLCTANAIQNCTHALSGQATLNGAGLAGVTMNLSGTTSGTTTTDAGGNYSFAGLQNGGYTVTPSLTGYTFNPTGAAVTVSGSDVVGINFAATAVP